MHSNAHECVRMRKNAPDCGITHTSHILTREKLQQVEDLNLPGEEYEKICSFESYNEAQGALWDMGGLVTSKSGRRGSTKTRSYHGGEKGKYKITCDKNGDGTAYLWAATNLCRMQLM